MKIFILLMLAAFTATAQTIPAKPGREVIPLNGPWKFHTGDNAGWAAPNFDDSKWETVSLAPQAGAHDNDVGLSGYVPGWGASGHAGYYGYAWYRLRVADSVPPDLMQAMTGPADADDVYQVFVNGRMLGGIGDFSGAVPVVYSIQPQFFMLPQLLWYEPRGAKKEMVIAFRVWASPRTMSDAPDAGGIHIAPVVGTERAVKAIYKKQWLQTFWGYVVDAIEPFLFILLALMACRLIRIDRRHTVYLWMAAALVLIALVRASQVFYYWGQWEDLKTYYLTKETFLIPMVLGAWAIAWHKWFGGDSNRWAIKIAVSLTAFYILVNVLSLSWQYEVPHPNSMVFDTISGYLRLLFLLLMLFITVSGVRQAGKKAWLAVIAIVLLLAGLFAQELSAVGIPGIWFPFGVGVSRTQYVYIVFDVLLWVLLLQRMRQLRKSLK
jgi:hypothetical protein